MMQVLTKKEKKAAREKRKAEAIRSQCIYYQGNHICGYYVMGGPCHHSTDRELAIAGIPRCNSNTCRRFETDDGYGWQKPTNKYKMLTQEDFNNECLKCELKEKGYCPYSRYYEGTIY